MPSVPAVVASSQTCVSVTTRMRLRFAELPGELLQSFADWLPSFAERGQLCCAFRAAQRLEWRLAPPLQLDEELSGIRLGDRGACAVAQAFHSRPQQPTIGELCLGNNGIGDAGAIAIAEVLQGGSMIRRLSLRDNEIGDAGAQAIAAALASNSVLEELDIWGNQLSDVGKEALLSVARCKVFLELDLHLCPSLLPATNTGKLRSVLLDWISQVHTGGNAPVALDGEADPQDMLFRTFGHLDAYLLSRSVSRDELQLAGVACTLAAAGQHSKASSDEEFEDTELAMWLAFVTDGACTAEDVREAAREVRQVLGFRMHQPTAYTFLRRYLRKTGWTQESFSLANYLIELAVISSEFTQYPPQAIAAAATILSRQYLSQGIGFQNIPCWKAKLLRCTHLDLQRELAPCAADMSRLHAAEHGCTNKFVNRKYEWTRLHMVAKINPNPSFDAAFFVDYLLRDPTH